MKFGTDGFRGPADSVITPDFCLKVWAFILAP